MDLLRKGEEGFDVLKLQKTLQKFGYEVNPSGTFDEKTDEVVRKFQEQNGLGVDGLVGSNTWKTIESTRSSLAFNKDVTDLVLNKGEFIEELYPKRTIYIHHTAGGSRPDWTIHGWNGDAPGRVGTAFVIGRRSPSGDEKYDGLTFRAFNEQHWAYHLGIKGLSRENNKRRNAEAVGIEICSYGWLTKGDDGKYYSFGKVGNPKYEVPEEDVWISEKPWRGQQYWHKYTEKQLAETKRLILTMAYLHDIPLDDIKYDAEWFDINEDAFNGKPGLWTHVNVRKDKTDCFPQPELIDMLNSLHEDFKTFEPELGGTRALDYEEYQIPDLDQMPEGQYSRDMLEAEG